MRSSPHLALFIVVAMPVLALAEPATANPWISAQVSQLFIDATEPAAGGGIANRDHGRLPALTLSTGTRAAGLDWQASFQTAQGTVAYRGATQLGIPLASTSRLHWQSLQLQATHPWADTPWSFGAQLDWTERRRAIAASQISLPLTETQSALALGLVVRGEWRLPGDWTLSSQASLSRNLNSHLDVVPGASFDPLRLALKPSWQSELSLTASRALQPGLQIQTSLTTRQLKLGTSDPAVLTSAGTPVGVLRYPGSTQRDWGLAVGVRYAWR
jgi:hypothetical protein